MKHIPYIAYLSALLLTAAPAGLSLAASPAAPKSATAPRSATAPKSTTAQGQETAPAEPEVVNPAAAKKLLFMGDSMTGWMAERINAYGEANGFEVATIVWDGSTIRKWGANAAKVKKYVEQIDPDAVFICLGLNESAEKNPETRLASSLSAILDAVGDREVVWIGPPSWPGKNYGEPLNSWLAGKFGKAHYFDSLKLKLPRQSATNPHPSVEGMCAWADSIMHWIPAASDIDLPGYNKPTTTRKRGKTFIYRKMKDTL